MKTYPSLCFHPREHRITLARWFNGSVWMRRYRCPHCDYEWEAWEDATGEDI
jgi:hypothetical protein